MLVLSLCRLLDGSRCRTFFRWVTATTLQILKPTFVNVFSSHRVPRKLKRVSSLDLKLVVLISSTFSTLVFNFTHLRDKSLNLIIANHGKAIRRDNRPAHAITRLDCFKLQGHHFIVRLVNQYLVNYNVTRLIAFVSLTTTGRMGIRLAYVAWRLHMRGHFRELVLVVNIPVALWSSFVIWLSNLVCWCAWASCGYDSCCCSYRARVTHQLTFIVECLALILWLHFIIALSVLLVCTCRLFS